MMLAPVPEGLGMNKVHFDNIFELTNHIARAYPSKALEFVRSIAAIFPDEVSGNGGLPPTISAILNNLHELDMPPVDIPYQAKEDIIPYKDTLRMLLGLDWSLANLDRVYDEVKALIDTIEAICTKYV